MNLSERRRSALLLAIIYLGFISLGLPDTVLGVTWNSMCLPGQMNKPIYYVGFITTVLLCCSTVSSFFSGAILRFLGTGRLLMICGLATALSMLGMAAFPWFFAALLLAVPLGFGQGAIDTGMNFYVAKHYTSRDMSWLHCCWGIGGSAGPAIAGWIINGGNSWRWAYVALGSVQLFLALLFVASQRLWGDAGKEMPQSGENPEDHGGKTVFSWRFWLCAVSFFFYSGIEMTVGLWSFAWLTQCRNVSFGVAGFCVAAYWGSLTLGRLLLGVVSNRLGARRLNFYSFIGEAAAGVWAMLPVQGLAAALPLLLLGFSFASIYPGMMHLAPRRFDDATAATLTGFQGGFAMLGAWLVPAATGFAGAKSGFGILPCMIVVFVLVYGLMQLSVDNWKIAKSNFRE